MDQLEKAYFFADFTYDELTILRSCTRILEARAGYLLLRQGQPSDNLFIVRTGSVRVMVPSPDEVDVTDNPEQTLVVLGPGECFGEFAFVDRKVSSATVIANEESTVYAIRHDELDRQLLANSTTAAKFYRALLHIIVNRIRNTDIELAIRKALTG